MKVDQPIASSQYGPLFVRVVLGAYFLLAGLAKLEDLSGFITAIKRLQIMPDHLATLYATVLPYVEVGAGAILIMGFWTTLGSALTTAILLSFIYSFGLFPSYPFNKDLILLGASLSLLCTGAGAMSVDRFRKSAK